MEYLYFARGKARILAHLLWDREWKLFREEWDYTFDDFLDASCDCCGHSEEMGEYYQKKGWL